MFTLLDFFFPEIKSSVTDFSVTVKKKKINSGTSSQIIKIHEISKEGE